MPEIDAIAVTAGPGLEPALWVGTNFAKALALAWDKPLVAVNHMEGHILAALASRRQEQEAVLEIQDVKMPLVALLISGGHTELVLMKNWLEYELIGQTLDDAVGEAFDKVARMLALPYPGGPEISKLAEEARVQAGVSREQTAGFGSERMSVTRLPDLGLGTGILASLLPRPMLNDASCNFSFSGLKTAVLYLLKKNPELDEREKQHLAREFEDAVTEVLWKKTARALEETGAQTLVLGGGVSANTHIRRFFKHSVDIGYPQISLRIPSAALTTDNAIMIALAGYYRALRKEFVTDIVAKGNLSLASV